jgi:hypothetical protein
MVPAKFPEGADGPQAKEANNDQPQEDESNDQGTLFGTV